MTYQLYYAPGACSLAPHIVLRELGETFNLVKVSTKTHKTEDGSDFYAINPKGYVPAMRLANGEILTEGAAVSAFLADKIRQRVKDPKLAAKLIPTDHLFGTKRPPGEKDYYEIFNLDHVEHVDLRETPIEHVNARGIETALPGGSSRLHELDVIVYATGFRAMTGELMRMNIVGERGQSLEEKWECGPKTHLGVQFAGFLNIA